MAQVQEATIIDEPLRIKQELKEKAQDITETYLRMSELLYEVQVNKYHIEFDYGNFNDYVQEELDMKPRKANYLVSIADAVYRLGIPWNDLKGIGWRKTAVVVPQLTQDNYTELLNEARVSSLPILNEKVKALKQGKESPSDPPVKLTIQMSEDEESIINSALEYIMSEYEIKTKGKALASICWDYLQDKDIGGQSDEAVNEENN